MRLYGLCNLFAHCNRCLSYTICPTQFFHKTLVAQALISTNPVFHMDTTNRYLKTLLYVIKKAKKCHRICATGHANHDTITRLHQYFLYYKITYPVLKFLSLHVLPFQCL